MVSVDITCDSPEELVALIRGVMERERGDSSVDVLRRAVESVGDRSYPICEDSHS